MFSFITSLISFFANLFGFLKLKKTEQIFEEKYKAKLDSIKDQVNISNKEKEIKKKEREVEVKKIEEMDTNPEKIDIKDELNELEKSGKLTLG